MNASHEMLIKISEEFSTKIGRLQYFTKHSPSIGTSHELVLKNFLQHYLPSSVAINTGFIYHPDFGASPQLDIIIWDQSRYAPLFVDGDLVVLRPDSVIVVIEVKTKLTKRDISNGVEILDQVHDIAVKNKKKIWTALFGFSSISVNNITHTLLNYEGTQVSNCPQQILVPGKFLLDNKKDKGLQFNMKKGNNNFTTKDVFPFFYASLINWVGKDIERPPKPLASQEQLEEYFDFKQEFYWSDKSIKIGNKELV